MAFTHYRTQGFILAKKDFREADRIFTIFCKDFGKIQVLARGIRKIKSKLRPGMQLFCLSQFEFIEGGSFKILIDALLIRSFQNLRKDLGRLSLAYKISETLNGLVRGQQKDTKIWDLLIETFQELDSHKLRAASYKLLYYYFLWSFFSALGYKPQLYHCCICNSNVDSKRNYFSSAAGGVICRDCAISHQTKQQLSPLKKVDSDTINILRILTEKEWSALNNLEFPISVQKPLKTLSFDYLLFLEEKI